MNEILDVPSLATILTATLLIAGAAVTLIGSFGLLRFRGFYQRVHAPTLGTTLGTIFIATASMIYFSALGTRPVLHELLVIVFVVTTTPITLMILVRAALFRDEAENE
jgi:multicomponent K+:H+ antiporter subunit G